MLVEKESRSEETLDIVELESQATVSFPRTGFVSSELMSSVMLIITLSPAQVLILLIFAVTLCVCLYLC